MRVSRKILCGLAAAGVAVGLGLWANRHGDDGPGASAERSAVDGPPSSSSRPLRPAEHADPRVYGWTDQYDPAQSAWVRIGCPKGFQRVAADAGSFAHWLRHLPLKPGRPEVRLFDGRAKRNQEAHDAVIDIDVGARDLQQCADAVIRLRAEYLYATGQADRVHFNFTSGDRADFARWADGFRPVVRGNEVAWRRSAAPDGSPGSFRRYLDVVFSYAGSYSLSRELRSVSDVGDIQAGDVWIRGGFPGHAAIVIDVAADGRTGRKAFLLALSYTSPGGGATARERASRRWPSSGCAPNRMVGESAHAELPPSAPPAARQAPALPAPAKAETNTRASDSNDNSYGDDPLEKQPVPFPLRPPGGGRCDDGE